MKQGDSKAVTVRFTIEIPKGYKYEGTSYAISCNFEMEFTQKEILLVKRFLSAYEHDAETDLMPILEENLPELYQRIDKKARETLSEFLWQKVISRNEGTLSSGELQKTSYVCHSPDTFLPKEEKLSRVKCQYNIGVMFYKGLDVPVDYEKARKWFAKAAEQGLADAQNNIGCIYVKGEGVPVDYVAARRWFTKAAEQGLADSQFNLGKIYHLGKGVPVDFPTARKWYIKALEQGYEYAKEGLSRLGDSN